MWAWLDSNWLGLHFMTTTPWSAEKTVQRMQVGQLNASSTCWEFFCKGGQKGYTVWHAFQFTWSCFWSSMYGWQTGLCRAHRIKEAGTCWVLEGHAGKGRLQCQINWETQGLTFVVWKLCLWQASQLSHFVFRQVHIWIQILASHWRWSQRGLGKDPDPGRN